MSIILSPNLETGYFWTPNRLHRVPVSSFYSLNWGSQGRDEVFFKTVKIDERYEPQDTFQSRPFTRGLGFLTNFVGDNLLSINRIRPKDTKYLFETTNKLFVISQPTKIVSLK